MRVRGSGCAAAGSSSALTWRSGRGAGDGGLRLLHQVGMPTVCAHLSKTGRVARGEGGFSAAVSSSP
jgi:hypothetical protein